MKASPSNIWYRLLFRVKIYEASGDYFQKLVNQLYEWSNPDFQSITPWGNWGDGGNDGWVPAAGQYFQVYGPKPTTQWQPVDAVKKAVEDFNKLPEKWKDVRKYSFVLNDRYCGIPAPVASVLQQLKIDHNLEDAGAICTTKLENLFMDLEEDQRQVIVCGGVPIDLPDFIDPRSVGELLSHLADKPSFHSKFLNESPPDFEKKIIFNRLTGQIAEFLRVNSYYTANVEEFLSRRESGLQQAIAEEIKALYDESKAVIPDEDPDAANIRYVWIVDKLIPDVMRKHPHSMKAYREAAQIIMAKYFETCDVYDHPERIATA
jgi:hypothetical protein